MADDGSRCVMTDIQIKITNIVYASLSFFSFIVGLISILLNCYCKYYYQYKFKYDPLELSSLVVFATHQMVESLQWFALFKYFIGCTVLGAVREYTLISVLVIVTCLGIHLFILMTQPKCLRVIKEEKQKRYRRIQKLYLIASFLVPIFFVPWPFIKTQYMYVYGKNKYLCWLADSINCNSSGITTEYVLGPLLMWYIWAVLVWVMAVAVTVFVFYRYCLHRMISKSTKSIPMENVTYIIWLIVYIVGVIVNAINFAWERFTGKSSFPLALQAVIVTPIVVMIFYLTIIVKQVMIIRAGPKEIFVNINGSTATLARSYGTTSCTHFLLPDNEWD